VLVRSGSKEDHLVVENFPFVLQASFICDNNLTYLYAYLEEDHHGVIRGTTRS
jgi:hypothetical protein